MTGRNAVSRGTYMYQATQSWVFVNITYSGKWRHIFELKTKQMTVTIKGRLSRFANSLLQRTTQKKPSLWFGVLVVARSRAFRLRQTSSNVCTYCRPQRYRNPSGCFRSRGFHGYHSQPCVHWRIWFRACSTATGWSVAKIWLLLRWRLLSLIIKKMDKQLWLVVPA